MKTFRSPVLAAWLAVLVLLVANLHVLHEQLASHPAGEVCDLCRLHSDHSPLLAATPPAVTVVRMLGLSHTWLLLPVAELPAPKPAARSPPV